MGQSNVTKERKYDMQVNPIEDLVSMLRPPAETLFDVINGTQPPEPTNIFKTLQSHSQNAYTSKDLISWDPVWINIWLQWPNQEIKDLAMSIINASDSDDIKMKKIQTWVFRNIEYMQDKEQYGFEELWVPPIMLLKTMKGDCEDGAFLIMSLGLNAGVDPTRLRMYGGFVNAGPGAASGGHGWIAYRRESDDEWVAVDYSYYVDLRSMDKRTPLKDDEKYVDDYFFMTNQYMVVTDQTNRIRNPEIYTPNGGYVQPNVLMPGSWLSAYA